MAIPGFWDQIGPALVHAGEKLDEFKKAQVDPALADVGGKLDGFKKAQVDPALTDIGGKLSEFRKAQLDPALADVGGKFDGFKKAQLDPALADIDLGEKLNEFGNTQLGPALSDAGQKLDELNQRLQPALADLAKKIDDFGKNQLGPVIDEAIEEAKEHPGRTAVQVASILTFIFPGIVSGPVLALLGYAPVGPQVSSIAAMIQSGIGGNVMARSPFAILQSAAMGGYGTAIVDGIFRVGAGIFGGLSFANGMGEEEDVNTEL